jgi:hypothetical protein
MDVKCPNSSPPAEAGGLFTYSLDLLRIRPRMNNPPASADGISKDTAPFCKVECESISAHQLGDSWESRRPLILGVLGVLAVHQLPF